MNTHQISKIDLSREVVDCIVFWTKNPARMINRLHLLSNYNYYFQFTITPYDQILEPNLPEKSEIIKSFIALSDHVGKVRVIWRYDPIILTAKHTIAFHLHAFEQLASTLAPHTRKCVISFVDLYRNSKKNLYNTELLPLSIDKMRQLAYSLSKIATHYGIELVSCAEELDLKEFGILHGKCIDDKLITEISGFQLDLSKDKTQRPECGCVGSVDIGAYNTCPHFCRYCYANFDTNEVKKNLLHHDKKALLLSGKINLNDKISQRKLFSCKMLQQKLL